jgi:hypothetical protein
LYRAGSSRSECVPIAAKQELSSIPSGRVKLKGIENGGAFLENEAWGTDRLEGWLEPMAHQQVVGNIGMYYAAYRLSQMGWNVMPTSRNARGIDLLAYDAPAGRYLGIQVKALAKKPPVPLGESIDKLLGDWWIIVTPTPPHQIRNASS